MPDFGRLKASKDAISKQLVDVISAAIAPKSRPQPKLPQSIAELVLTDDGELLPVAVDVAATLAAAAGEPSTANRSGVLEVLLDLAVGYDPYGVLAHGVDDALLARELAPKMMLRDLRGPICEHAPGLLPLLDDKDAKVRSGVAQLLAVLPEARPTAALKTALGKETDPVVRYDILFALASHGARADVPKAKNAKLSVIARYVGVLHGGDVDPKLIEDTRKLPAKVAGFPGGDVPYRAVVAGLVREMWRRKKPKALLEIVTVAKTGGDSDMIAHYALDALWAYSRPPIEPRSVLSAAERAWLAPLFGHLSQNQQMPITNSLVRHGLVPDWQSVSIRRLLGLAKGPADEKIGDVPAWLLARRVVDGREPLQKWIDAMRGRAPGELISIVKDLVTFALPDPWPTIRLPYKPTAVHEAYARYFALVRATYALVPLEDLAALVDDERADAHQVTALASSVDRGAKLPKARDTRIKELLQELDEYDVEGLRVVLRALPEDRRSAVLEGISPDYESDGIYKKARLSGLWYFADLVPDALLDTLIEHLVQSIAVNESLTKAKTPHQQAIGAGLRSAIESTLQRIGPRAAGPLQRALKSLKAKSPARPVVELALAAAKGGGGRAAVADSGNPKPARPASPKEQSKKGTIPELSTLTTWTALPRARRVAIQEAIARALRFTAGDLIGPHQLAEVVSKKGLRFVAIPGGSFDMGMRDEDLARVAAFGLESELREHARPVHRVTVRSFLCARSPLRDEDGALLFLDGDDATEMLSSHQGYRVMSEAEWELVARNVGLTSFIGTDDIAKALSRVEAATDAEDDPTSTSNDETPLGIGALPWGEFVADAFHPDYDGAPADGSAWDAADTLEYWRGGTAQGYPYQEELSITECLAAFRPVPPLGDSMCLRLARDLPEIKLP